MTKVVTEQLGLESNPRGGEATNYTDVKERSVPNSRPDSAKVLRLGKPGESNKSRQPGKQVWNECGRGMEEEVVEGLQEPTILSLSVH